MWDRTTCLAESCRPPRALVCALFLALLASTAPRPASAAEFAGLARCFLDGSIQAHVVDYASRRPLAHAQVTLSGTPFVCRTDKTGALELHDVPAGTYRARITCRGYLTGVVSVRVAPDRPTIVDVSLLVAEDEADFKLAQTAAAPNRRLPALGS